MKNKVTFPDLVLEDFFLGKVLATGHIIYFYPKKKIKSVKANFLGKLKHNTLHLQEKYIEDKQEVTRNWIFNKISNDCYTGTEKNLVKNLIAIKKDNNIEMTYKFKTNFKKLHFNVKVKDSMFLVSNNHLLNTTSISKLGVNIAKAILLYRKL